MFRIGQFFKKLTVFILPNSIILNSKFKDGTMVSGLNKSGYGGRGVFIFGEELEPELKLLSHIINKGDIVIDVGANVGVYTMKAAKIVGNDGLVIALEPFPRIADMNLRNALKNKFSNIRLRVCCVSDKVGNQNFWMKKNRPNEFSLIQFAEADCYNSRVVTIDSLVEEENLERVDFIKIDAEGSENQILNGSLKTLSKFKPIILTEILITQNPIIPPGYLMLKYKDSFNVLLVHQDSIRLEDLLKVGFRELDYQVKTVQSV